MPDWATRQYLRTGTKRQQTAYQALQAMGIMTILRPYDALLVGTIPIGIDTPQSDLDIICEVHAFDDFVQVVASHWGTCTAFAADTTNNHCVICWQWYRWQVEVYAEPCPVYEQNAYVHMVVEHRLLVLGGAPLRAHIRRLKAQGMKTEPAFVEALKLWQVIPNAHQDPYMALYELASYDDAQLGDTIKKIRNND